MLDNSVAGGIPGGTSAFDSLVKEAAEEASLDPELLRKRARAVGAVSYYRQTTAGWLQPEVQYVYDMRVEPDEVRLAPMDGEVESFEVSLHIVCESGRRVTGWAQLMSVDEVVSCMRASEFKPNCALGASTRSFSFWRIALTAATSPNRLFGAPWVLDARE